MSIAGRILRIVNSTYSFKNAITIQERNYHRWLAPTLKEFQARKLKRVKKTHPNPRNTYLEWNQDAEMYAFGKRLKEEFEPAMLQRAFTHRSHIIQEELKQIAVGIENPNLQLQDNKEFIREGESFMSDYIASYLQAALPKFPDAGISAVRDHLMTTAVLAKISSHLGTKDLILAAEYPITEDTLASTLKAVVAALIHSSDSERAAHFVRDFVITMLNTMDVNDLWKIDEPMKTLQELLKKEKMPEVEPRLIGQTATNTVLACFRIGLYINKEMFSTGFGETIDIAMEMAAREGLKIFFGTQDNMAPIDFKIPGLPRERTQQMKSIEAS